MRAKAIIHLDRFSQNVAFVKQLTGKPVCVPVKADAYGHGALQIAGAALEAGAFCLGVSTTAEGTELRRGGIACPILLFAHPHPDEITETIESELIPFISDLEYAKLLNERARERLGATNAKLPVHIKIDTGMGRLGCPANEAPQLAKYISACAALELAGTATHFACADSENEDDKAYTEMQIARFKEAVQAIRGAGISPGIVHAANSGAVLQYPESWFDMVRPGILLYGYATAAKRGLSAEIDRIKPVMELRTTVSLIKKAKKGEPISYGRTWTAPRDTNIAVLAIGYGDGLPRSASNKWQTAINGKAYPLVGRICMDQCFADIGAAGDGVKLWDEAVIFGGDAASAAELAEIAGTIPYEITCNINKRAEKVYTK